MTLKPPKGYHFVTKGKVRPDDIYFSLGLGVWCPAGGSGVGASFVGRSIASMMRPPRLPVARRAGVGPET